MAGPFRSDHGIIGAAKEIYKRDVEYRTVPDVNCKSEFTSTAKWHCIYELRPAQPLSHELQLVIRCCERFSARDFASPYKFLFSRSAFVSANVSQFFSICDVPRIYLARNKRAILGPRCKIARSFQVRGLGSVKLPFDGHYSGSFLHLRFLARESKNDFLRS